MKDLLENNRENNLFKSNYCSDCKQKKVCGKLDLEICCSCAYQNEQERTKEYISIEKLLSREKRKQKEKFQQLELLRNYQGCKQCRSKEVDAYLLYENSRLVCQPCLIRKEGSATGAISFFEQSKWYKKRWGINLNEWLENFLWLPVSKKCADKWKTDKAHLKNCGCLEQEARKIYLLFTNSLQKSEKKLKNCKCKKSEKVRVSSDDYAWCERCEGSISVASKKRVIKNRNDPRFWGLEIKEKVLCLACIRRKYYEEMVNWQRKKFREYLRRGYV